MKKIFISLLAVAALAACTKSEVAYEAPAEIGFAPFTGNITKAEGKVNSMTIGWGTLGIQWGKPIFIAFVRGCRHTSPMLEENAEFTINIPLEAADKEIIRFCGTKSGRDVDKIKELDLHLEEPDVISVPGIKELPLTLECKVIYKQDQDSAALHPDVMARYYKPGTRNEGDYHTMYFGEITAAYIIE